MSELITKLWTWYQGKPAQVTVLSSGALLVDANQLLAADAAQKQIAQLEDFPLVSTDQGVAGRADSRDDTPEVRAGH